MPGVTYPRQVIPGNATPVLHPINSFLFIMPARGGLDRQRDCHLRAVLTDIPNDLAIFGFPFNARQMPEG